MLTGDNPKRPEDYGFSPAAAADVNVAALQASLDGGGLTLIDTPGVYDLNETIFLDSNTRLVCCPGVIFRKVAPYCNVLINRGALNREFNENITIDGLEVSVNGQEAPPTLVSGLRAQMGFFYVKNLTIRNFTCTDGKRYQFLIYIVTWSNLLIENVRLAGDKDGIKLSNGHDAVIRELDLTTYDDGISLCGTDYSCVMLEVGDVYNVHCSNITDHQYKNIFGRTCLICPGSWADYRDGNEYGSGDMCLHEGNLYQVDNEGGFTAASSSPPVHQGGVVTAADKISWRFVQPCDFHQSNVYNVTFDNCVFEKSGNIIATWSVPDWHYQTFAGVHRPFYPGTERDSNSWGITIKNCRMTAAGPQTLICLMGNMRDVTIDSCHFANPRCTAIHVDRDSPNEKLIAYISDCVFAGTGTDDTTVQCDYQDCPILRRHIDDAGKFVAVHNGGRVICSASGNAHHSAGMNVAATNGSQLRLDLVSTSDRPALIPNSD